MTTLKIIGIVLLLLLCYAAFAYFRTRHFVRIGIGLAEAAVAYEQHPDNPEYRVLFIGDSSAVGVGADTPEDSVPGRFGAAYPKADITNMGLNGRKTPELLEDLQQLQGQQFELVVIHTGGNDIVRWTPFADTESSLREALQLAKNLSPNVVVLHGGDVGTAKLLPAGTRWAFHWRTKRVYQIFERVAAEEGVAYADFWNIPGDDPFRTQSELYYAADNFHPGSRGYEFWFAQIQKAIEKTNFGK